MRHCTFILFISFSSLICLGQKQIEAQKITDFKNNYLKRAKLDKPDTLHLDNLTIVREKKREFRLIKTFYKNKNLVLHEYYYNKTTQIKSIFEYDSLGRPIGIAKHFKQNGFLEYIQDYDQGQWSVYDKENYPFYDLQNTIKLKADSLVSKMYGYSFLLNHTTWVVGGSYISNEKERERWTAKLKSVPTKFEFCYKVNLDSQKMYQSYIYFDLDDNGDFLPSYRERGFFFNGYGFENVPENKKGSFRLNYSEALLRAKSFGLTETDSTKASGRLHWESFRKLNIIDGQFRFYIAIKTNEVEKINSSGRSFKTTKYDVYIFNPWTNEFVELKKMKINYWWEEKRSGWTELIPDNE
jgi:hypothetical protein